MSNTEKKRQLSDAEAAEVQGGLNAVPWEGDDDPVWKPYTDSSRSFYCPGCNGHDLDYDARTTGLPNLFRCKKCGRWFYKKESKGYTVGSGW